MKAEAFIANDLQVFQGGVAPECPAFRYGNFVGAVRDEEFAAHRAAEHMSCGGSHAHCITMLLAGR